MDKKVSKFNLIQKIDAISLTSAIGCNLNCSYCLIEKNVNKHNSYLKELQKNTIEALENGQYLENIVKTLNKLGQSPKDIKNIQIWGQEPTVTLHHLTNHFEDWINTFNIENFMFSSNGIAFTDRIIDFIKAYDYYSKHKCYLELQFSYDGAEQTNELRKADDELIISNVKKLIKELNNIHLKNLFVTIQFHGVLTPNLIQKLNTTEKIQKYVVDYSKVINEIFELSLNKNVEIINGISFSQEAPQFATKEDGLRLADFYRMGCGVDPSVLNNRMGSNLWYGIIQVGNIDWEGFAGKDIDSIEEILPIVLSGYKDKEQVERFSNQLFCGANNGALKIMYDGTLLPCQNHMYELNKENIVDNNDIISGVKKSLPEHNTFINVLTDSDEKIMSNLSTYKAFKENSYYFTFTTTLSLMYYLLLSNQIDQSYKTDAKKFLLHAAILSGIHQCSYNNLIVTGSAMTKHTGMIRLYCNGYLDYVVNYYRERGKI